MKYINVSDKEYKGIDITIYETKAGHYTVDLKKPCGELIWGWELVGTFNCALMKGVAFIDQMPQRGYAA